MNLHETLPFTSNIFFLYATCAIILVLLAKQFAKQILPYKTVLTLISIAYILLLYPKPIHIIILVFYLYLSLLALRKFYKSDNIVFPMLILSLPIFAMKSVVFIPDEHDSYVLRDFYDFVTIAGLSYMVFKVIGLYIDERSNQHKIKFIDFFNFTTFIPTLLIGPLDRYQRFTNDVNAGYKNISATLFKKGYENLILGLLFKFILANFVGNMVLQQLVDDGSLFYHICYMYTYLLFLFFDFAGYSFLAISFGNFLGIHVPINFDKPFLAVNPKEFWKKWHKSLGDWLNDYFFKPLFKWFTTKKIAKSIQRQNISLFLTFTLMGFWNGFQLHFILSGMLFGLYSVLHNYYIYKCKKNKRDVVFGKISPKLIQFISIFLMFNSVAFAIYIFSGKLF